MIFILIKKHNFLLIKQENELIKKNKILTNQNFFNLCKLIQMKNLIQN